MQRSFFSFTSGNTANFKFMFIIISIYSKNATSLTNFLKFFYKLKKNQNFKLEFHVVQSQKKKSLSFFSTLQSPHVNKKSQEQFEYRIYGKSLKIHVSQLVKFLTAWKLVKTILFSDIEMRTKFCFYFKPLNLLSLCHTDYDKFILKFIKQELRFTLDLEGKKNLSNTAMQTSLKL